jgi:hypothetical protein
MTTNPSDHAAPAADATVSDVPSSHADAFADAARKPLTPAAERALAEAAARRAANECRTSPTPREVAGRDGLEPVRYGDWEINGLARDF